MARKQEHDSLECVNGSLINGPFITQTDVGPATKLSMTQAKGLYQVIHKAKHGCLRKTATCLTSGLLQIVTSHTRALFEEAEREGGKLICFKLSHEV